jgi:hypothetical protein
MRKLTFGQLQKAVVKTGAKYFVLTDFNGFNFGINSVVITRLYKKYGYQAESIIVAYKPCSLMEYITYKIPFL